MRLDSSVWPLPSSPTLSQVMKLVELKLSCRGWDTFYQAHNRLFVLSFCEVAARDPQTFLTFKDLRACIRGGGVCRKAMHLGAEEQTKEG